MRSIALFTLLAFWSVCGWSSGYVESLNSYESSALLVIDSDGKVAHSRNPDRPLIPASTLKILTALIALEHWGNNYRFTTNFFFDETTHYLWVKGLGDPFLTSEELDRIVSELKSLGLTHIAGVGIDTRYFTQINIDGQSNTNNPYDAPLSAIAANFNTIQIRIKDGSINPGEPQTPITLLAKMLSKGLPTGNHRVNLDSTANASVYFAELLTAKLNSAGIATESHIIQDAVPDKAKKILVHSNSHSLEEIVTAMLKYSNNFIANQLFLLLGGDIHGAPATVEKSQAVVNDFINEHFDWNDYTLVEGAGLSRLNRLSARQLTDILKLFEPYQRLMPSHKPGINAKTGTLNNVSTYAGYIDNTHNQSTFALMINQAVNYSFREGLAEELLKRK